MKGDVYSSGTSHPFTPRPPYCTAQVLSTARGVPRPTLMELVDRFGEEFIDLAAQLRVARRDSALLGRHAAVARVTQIASAETDATGGLPYAAGCRVHL